MPLTPQSIIDLLQLEPLPIEGGYFCRTYVSGDELAQAHLPPRYVGQEAKPVCSAIYYLLTPDTYSKIHRLRTDEIFHFYLGDPVEMLLLYQNGAGEIRKIGNDLVRGFRPQVVVPKYTWQGCRLIAGGRFALMGTTMAPAFEEGDFELPEDIQTLVERYPARFQDWVQDLF